MAKIKAPGAPAPTEVEAPAAPDMSVLLSTLDGLLGGILDADKQKEQSSLDIIIACREFREENPNLERNDLKLTIQQACANKYGIKLTAVQNDNKPGAKGYSAYTLVSALLSAAWPKGESEEKRVAKAIKEGKGYVEVRKAASKRQTNRAPDASGRKITEENFPTKFATFLTQAQADTGKSMEDIIEMAEVALEAIKSAPKE